MLFIWSKTNEEVGYFQGLNDLAVPFFIVYLSAYFGNELQDISQKLDSMTISELATIEADVYWSLNALTEQLEVFSFLQLEFVRAFNFVSEDSRV